MRKRVYIAGPYSGGDVAVNVGAVHLIVRTNRANGNQFLGCPRWPECDYTEPIPDCVKMRLAGAPELFT